MTDLMGHTIRPGNHIAYPSRARGEMWLRLMRVLTVEGGRISGVLHHSGRAATITRDSRAADVVIVQGTP